MAFLPNMEKKIHVLLVEHDIKDLDKTINMLHYFYYEVTQVNLASAALSILSKATINVDLVMANMNSPDSCGFQLLLHEAIQRDLLVILMSNDDDSVTTMRALQQGAFLRIKKPVTMQITGYLWQHVFREKVRKQFREVIDYNNIQDFGDQACHIEGNQNTNSNEGERQKSKKKLSSGSTSQNDNEFKKKVWIEWTEELHYKFVAAVIQLGEGRCYPKEILELMNEPRLTRMQVASHLQKCRNAKWLPPGERKSKQANIESTAPKNKVRRSRNERFGSMPLIDNDAPIFNLRSQNYHNDQSTIGPPVQTNVHAGCDEGYYPQLVLGDHGSNYPFTHASEIFNMGHLGQTPSDVTEDTTFEDQNMDSMVQIFSAALQQDLEMDYNLNQMTTATNTSSEWSQEEQESVNDEETKG